MYSYKQRKKQSKYRSKRGHLVKYCKYLDILVQRNSTNGFTNISKMENCIKNESNLNAYTITKKKKLPHLRLLKHALLAENAVGIPLVKQ